jgi:hypothetical protein
LDKILEFHLKIEKLDKAIVYQPEGRISIFSTPKILDILTDKVLVTPHEVKQLMRRLTA